MNAADEIWLLVETDRGRLSVMRDNRSLYVFQNIAIGQNGVTREKLRGDRKTPLGRYRISWVNDKSRFYRFFGLNYPSIQDAKRGYYSGVITSGTFRDLLHAAYSNVTPRQQTPLGGQLGIHGLGPGDSRLHSKFNWTLGCVALTNRQIDRLSRWVSIGTVVEIR